MNTEQATGGAGWVRHLVLAVGVLVAAWYLTLGVEGVLGASLLCAWSVLTWCAMGARSEMAEEVAAQRMLAELGKMSALLAHELRNPLAAAIGQAELLEMLLPDGRTREKASEINRELERLEDLSFNLLTFVNSRRVTVGSHEVARLVEDVERLARAPGLEIDASRAPARWSFDQVTLVRAVDNVVSNALAFAPEGTAVSMSVSQEGERLVIEVRDRGPGFDQEVDAFEAFVTTRADGTGLGLAITAEIVNAHGGHVTTENHEQGGAIVTLSLPGRV